MDPNIRVMLQAHAQAAAILGNRIYAQRIPQQVAQGPRAYPCAVFQRVGSNERETFCGADGLVAGLFQIDTYGPERDAVLEAARAVRLAMVHYSGDAGGVHVNRVRRDSALDVGPEVEPGLYRRVQTFTVWYVENENG